MLHRAVSLWHHGSCIYFVCSDVWNMAKVCGTWCKIDIFHKPNPLKLHPVNPNMVNQNFFSVEIPQTHSWREPFGITARPFFKSRWQQWVQIKSRVELGLTLNCCWCQIKFWSLIQLTLCSGPTHRDRCRLGPDCQQIGIECSVGLLRPVSGHQSIHDYFNALL